MSAHALESLAAAVVFAMIFLTGDLTKRQLRKNRWILSAAAGISVGYVFIHLLPELSEATEAFIHHTSGGSLPFSEYRVYFAAMLGFLWFYGLEHTRKRHGRMNDEAKKRRLSQLHITGFAVYAWLISYLIVSDLEKGMMAIAIYTLSMGMHFLSVDASLRHEHGKFYTGSGCRTLAGASILGWVTGMLFRFSLPLEVTLLGFISGGVIMISMIAELPDEKEGKFLPFLLGGFFLSLVYGIVYILIIGGNAVSYVLGEGDFLWFVQFTPSVWLFIIALPFGYLIGKITKDMSW